MARYTSWSRFIETVRWSRLAHTSSVTRRNNLNMQKKDTSKMATLYVRIPQSQKTWLHKIAFKDSVPESVLVRAALYQFIGSYGTK